MLKIHFFVLQGKIAFINEEYQEALDFLQKGLGIATEFDQKDLESKIKVELEHISKQLNKNTTSSKESAKQRFKEIEIENYIRDAFKILNNTND